MKYYRLYQLILITLTHEELNSQVIDIYFQDKNVIVLPRTILFVELMSLSNYISERHLIYVYYQIYLHNSINNDKPFSFILCRAMFVMNTNFFLITGSFYVPTISMY